MRFSKIMLITLILCGVSVLSPGCASKSAPAPEGQVVTVQRGNLRLDITGVGNLALSQKVDLAFEMAGTVEEVLVKEADSVKEGQLLAKLVISEWEEQLTALEDKVIAAERSVTAKERAVTDKERTVTDKERKVTTAERTVTDKERKVTTAESQVTVKKLDLLQAQVNLNNAQLALEKTEAESTDRLEIEIKELQVEIAKGRVEDAKIALEKAATEGIEDAKIAVEDAKIAVADAKIAVEDAKQGVQDARIAVEDAKKALENAKKALDEAKNASPEIKAPFTGFITKVNVSGGAEIKKGTVAVTIADPTKFEAEVMVSEANILKVKLGEAVSVQVEAMPGMSLPAKVTHISPTATIQSGVVNYKVKVELESLQSVMQKQQQAGGNLPSDNISSGGQQQQRQQTQAAQPGGQPGQTGQSRVQRGQPGAQSGQMPTMVSGDFQLKEGLTVRVSIITAERNGVLLVPNQAIKTQGRETLVKVLKDGVIEERSVQTGISNWQYTEITSGLSEGEQVIVPKVTSTAPTTQQQPQPPGAMQQMQRILR